MFRSDDYLVMDDDTAALSQTSPEAMVKYQRELAAVFNTIHSQERLVNIMSMESGVDGTLLSLLCTLLGISVINTPDRSKHYSYYLQVRGSRKALPSTDLLDRLNSYEQVWGFPYGSLGYPMYYYPTTYMHPSRMVHTCIKHYLRGGSMDIDTYMQPIQEVLGNLQVLSDNLPVVADWYLTQGVSYSATGDMEEKAYTTLSSLAKVWLRSGLCPISNSDVLHLTFPPQWRALYEELIYVRRASEWVPSASTGTSDPLSWTQSATSDPPARHAPWQALSWTQRSEGAQQLSQQSATSVSLSWTQSATKVEQLLLPLMSISPIADPQGLRNATSYILGICAPGGWDLLLVVLAAQLINEAYIKAYQAPWDRPGDIGGAASLLEQAYAPPLRRVGVIVRELDNAR